MTRPRDLPTMARPCAAITNRELADEVTYAPISTHMAAGIPRNAPAADWSEIAVLVFAAGAFLAGFGVAGGFHG